MPPSKVKLPFHQFVEIRQPINKYDTRYPIFPDSVDASWTAMAAMDILEGTFPSWILCAVAEVMAATDTVLEDDHSG